MKKFITVLTLAAFAVVAQAEDKACPAAAAKDKGACADKAAACADKEKAACCEKKAGEKAACPVKAAKEAAAKEKVQSPRGSEANKS